MATSERLLKWIVRFYPPLFFQRIWVLKFHNGFVGADVKIFKSFLNKNYNKSIFGGTIFSAADPFHPLLIHQQLKRKGYKIISWSKSCHIQYIKPAITDLYFNLTITRLDIEECESALVLEGRFMKAYPVHIYDNCGELCASMINEVYVRNLNYTETKID